MCPDSIVQIRDGKFMQHMYDVHIIPCYWIIIIIIYNVYDKKRYAHEGWSEWMCLSAIYCCCGSVCFYFEGYLRASQNPNNSIPFMYINKMIDECLVHQRKFRYSWKLYMDVCWLLPYYRLSERIKYGVLCEEHNLNNFKMKVNIFKTTVTWIFNINNKAR